MRVNAIDTPFFKDDLRIAVRQSSLTYWISFATLTCAQLQMPHVRTLILPKIHSSTDLDYVAELLSSGPRSTSSEPIRLVASMESARAVWDIGAIASWKALKGAEAGGLLSALLVQAVSIYRSFTC